MSVYPTPFGPVIYSQDPRQARENSYDTKLIVASMPRFSKRHAPVVMQRPAVKAWREAEKLLGRKLGKGPWARRRARAITTTGTWRGYDTQAALYRSDPQRYARPNVSGHVQGLAGDVRTDHPHFALAIECLEQVGFRRVRPSDEPWHVAWGVKV